ncbi:hypothetical protein CP354_02500 [Lactobacillus sp. UMNPBX3]|nr:phage tail tip lysozyme [Limosilactobacillus reuteri]PEH08639.1 hypothetical protein CP354_02500 [Lactobacillus sp. UMNPBX3]UFK66973.1 hypothetical protein IU404_02441 [Limosilactobacillus reuteri]
MQLNHKLGVFLAAPFALLVLSATNVHADNIQSNSNQTISNMSLQTNDTKTQQNVVMSNDAKAQITVNPSSNANSSSVAKINEKNNVKSDTDNTNVESNADNIGNIASSDSTAVANSASSDNIQSFNVNTQEQPAINVSELTTEEYVTNYTQQQINNATTIHDYFINQGWTPNAIAGMLGNFVSESGLIPDLHQYGGGPGYGLAQWPFNSVVNWCRNNGYDYRTLQGQCAYIEYQMTHGQQYYPSAYSRMTANEYMHSYASAYTLGMIWLNNFERPANRNQPARGQQAQYWYQYFQSHGSTSAPVQQNPSTPATTPSSSRMSQHGTFKVAYGLNVRQAPSTSAAIVTYYNGGQSFTYDSKIEANGYLWVSYMSYSGVRRYVAIKNLNNGTTYGYDSNNFSYSAPASSTPSTNVPSTPAPSTSTSSTEKQYGTFKVAYGLNVRQAPSTSAAIVTYYNGGQSFTYDSKIEANGYLWVSYMSYSGVRRYVAIKNLSNGTTYGYDSNNFSFNGTPVTSNNNPSSTPAVPQGNKGQQVVALARQQIGKPYVWGATGPNSFDCSGLVQYVYRQVGVNLPRTTTQQEYCGHAVSFNNLQPGDLMFWGKYGSAYHVGIYTGNGNVLFAPQPGQTVKEQPMRYYMPAFARRVL